MPPDRTYHDALRWMNSLKTVKITDVTEGSYVPSTLELFLIRLGHQCILTGKMNIIEIIVPKSRSSVSVFIESIVRRTRPGWNTGIYILSSDHRSPCERIYINGKPISESLFTSYFFDVWDRLCPNHPDPLDANELDDMPDVSRFILLLALHIFIRENVEATIIEIDAGCSHDHSTGALNPIVVGTTSLSLFSFRAWPWKQNVPLIVQEQKSGTVDQSVKEFQDIKPTIITTSPIRELADIELGITGPDEMENAIFAVHIAKAFFSTIDPLFKLAYSSPPLPFSFIVGLQKANAAGQ